MSVRREPSENPTPPRVRLPTFSASSGSSATTSRGCLAASPSGSFRDHVPRYGSNHARASDSVLVACPVTASLLPPLSDSSRSATLPLSSLHSLSTPTSRCASTPATYWLCSLPPKGRISMVCPLTRHTARRAEATTTRSVTSAPTTPISSRTSRRNPVRALTLESLAQSVNLATARAVRRLLSAFDRSTVLQIIAHHLDRT